MKRGLDVRKVGGERGGGGGGGCCVFIQQVAFQMKVMEGEVSRVWKFDWPSECSGIQYNSDFGMQGAVIKETE